MADKKDGAGKPVLPNELNRIVDKVLAFKPKPNSKAATKRAEQTRRIELSAMKKAAD